MSSAEFGTAGILPISLMYLNLMGDDLVKSTQYSLLNANYLLSLLKPHYKILYSNKNGQLLLAYVWAGFV